MPKCVKIIECPRDAMQGIKTFIPTKKKIQYLQSLLRVGFDTIDFGSFVSPRAIPQMQDTAEVLSQLDLSVSNSKLLAIIANVRGAKAAASFKEIDYLGFPFSISENFQMRNTHKTIAESVEVLKEILEITHKQNKELVVYLSMAFGNPYGDPWNVDVVGEWTERLYNMGVRILSLSDTIGSSSGRTISYLFLILFHTILMWSLVHIYTLTLHRGMKKLMQLLKQDVFDLMVPFKDLEVALWPKMILPEICLQRR